eukprot:4647850-Amphidinium_carterae.1
MGLLGNQLVQGRGVFEGPLLPHEGSEAISSVGLWAVVKTAKVTSLQSRPPGKELPLTVVL